MKKIVGLLAFAVALAGAILLTQYYSRALRAAPPPRGAPGAAESVPTRTRAGTARQLQDALATLDPAAGRGEPSLTLERDPDGRRRSVWVWAYSSAPTRRVATARASPELRRPSPRPATKIKSTVVSGCPAPRPTRPTTRESRLDRVAFAARSPRRASARRVAGVARHPEGTEVNG